MCCSFDADASSLLLLDSSCATADLSEASADAAADSEAGGALADGDVDAGTGGAAATADSEFSSGLLPSELGPLAADAPFSCPSAFSLSPSRSGAFVSFSLFVSFAFLASSSTSASASEVDSELDEERFRSCSSEHSNAHSLQ